MSASGDLARVRFPTIQRSGTTISASGVSGSSSRPPLLSNSPALSRPIQSQSIERPLYEIGSEGPSIGTFSANDNEFLVLEATIRGKYLKQHLVSRIAVSRPAAPPLEDYDARVLRLPRKTAVVFGRHKRKKKIRKSKKINENKRRRPLSPPRAAKYVAPPVTPRAMRAASPGTRNRFDAQAPAPRPPTGKQTPVIFQRARKTAFQRPPLPSATPTPPPMEDFSSRLALDAIAQGIFRLDPPLARYSLRSTPLFLARNLRDGWAGKVWTWDQAGTDKSAPASRKENYELSRRRLDDFVAQAARQTSRHTLADVTQVSLPRTFSLKLKRFELKELAKIGIPDSAKLAAVLYINNPSTEPLVYDLGVSSIDIPKSASNFLPSPHQIPPLEPSNANLARPEAVVPFFVKTSDSTHVSLRALRLPGGIAYVDLLLFDFTNSSVPAGDTVTWGPSTANRLYSRVELVGPNASSSGFATSAQRTQLTWLRVTRDPLNSYNDTNDRTEHQPQAFLHLDIDWGIDSAAPLPYARVSNIPPQRPRPPSPDAQIIYRLGIQGENHVLQQTMQPWGCILCSICAPFPSLHVLRVHIERAHAQVQTTFGRERWDPIANKRRVEIRMELPPASVELISDDEIQIPEKVAPSTRIGAILAAQGNDRQASPPEAPMRMSMTPPLAPEMTEDIQDPQHRAEPETPKVSRTTSGPVKEEDRSTPPSLDPRTYLPIARLESRSPEPLLGSPVRAVANRTGVLHGYSSRVNNLGQIYDVLHTLPVKNFGAVAEQVFACEEELFAQEATYGSRAGVKVGSERGRLLSAMWTRWMVTERNKFIRNPFECISRFLESGYAEIIANHVGDEHIQGFLLVMVTRRFIVTKQAAVLLKKFKRRAELGEEPSA